MWVGVVQKVAGSGQSIGYEHSMRDERERDSGKEGNERRDQLAETRADKLKKRQKRPCWNGEGSKHVPLCHMVTIFTVQHIQLSARTYAVR